MRATVAHIYSVDITATFLLLSQPRTSTRNVRLAVSQVLLSFGNAVVRLFGCMDPRPRRSPSGFGVKCQLCPLPPRPHALHLVCPFWTAACLFLVGFPVTFWTDLPPVRCLPCANKGYSSGRQGGREAGFQSPPPAPLTAPPLGIYQLGWDCFRAGTLWV